MIEIVMVLAVIGIMAALAIPRLNTRGFHADAATRFVRGTLQVAQRTAVARQYDVIVSFDAGTNALRVTEDRNNNGNIDNGERTRWERLENGPAFVTPPAALPGFSGSGAIVIPGTRSIGGLPSVIFRRNGAASSELAVYMAAMPGDTASLRAVSMEQATGRTRWFRYVGGAWKAASQ
jgi:type II secretory pathway pseudopilin PulG